MNFSPNYMRAKRGIIPQKVDEIFTIDRSGFRADDEVCEGEKSDTRENLRIELLGAVL